MNGESSEINREVSANKGRIGRGASILDFILRIVAVTGTLGSAIAMGTITNQTPPRFNHFQAQYSDLPTLTFFVVANSIVGSYLVLSLIMLSILHIIRSSARESRLILVFFDTFNGREQMVSIFVNDEEIDKTTSSQSFLTNRNGKHLAMLTLLTAGASSTGAIVYLAHNGNVQANWFAICKRFNSFCERIFGPLIGSFGAIVVLIMLIFLSSAVLSKH